MSPNGGMNPHWSRDGKELFYVGTCSLMRVPVGRTGTAVSFGDPEPMFELPYRTEVVTTGVSSNMYGVAPDGQRFLFNVPLDDSPNPLKLIVNWPQRLRQ